MLYRKTCKKIDDKLNMIFDTKDIYTDKEGFHIANYIKRGEKEVYPIYFYKNNERVDLTEHRMELAEQINKSGVDGLFIYTYKSGLMDHLAIEPKNIKKFLKS